MSRPSVPVALAAPRAGGGCGHGPRGRRGGGPSPPGRFRGLYPTSPHYTTQISHLVPLTSPIEHDGPRYGGGHGRSGEWEAVGRVRPVLQRSLRDRGLHERLRTGAPFRPAPVHRKWGTAPTPPLT